MRICILDCDRLAPPLASRFHSYGRLFQALLGSIAPGVETRLSDVREGEYPASDEVFSAYLLTGSQSDAFSREPWINQLRGYVSEQFERGQVLVGICFGHQLLAEVFGGRVGRAHKGWGLGLTTYRLEQMPDWMHLPSQHSCSLSMYASHQDQVVQLPPRSTVFLANSHCPCAGYFIGHRVLGLQPHPEFTPEYARALLEFRRARLGEHLYQRALKGLDDAHDGARMMEWILNFIARGCGD